MQELYESVIALLAADDDLGDTGSLAAMLHTVMGTDDPRIYKTSVQAHVQAANTDIRWITVNKVADVPDEIEQIQDVRIIDFVTHVWAREDTAEVAEAILERIQDLLDGANLVTSKLLAWYCRWQNDLPPVFEAETRTQHLQARYQCMVMAQGDAP